MSKHLHPAGHAAPLGRTVQCCPMSRGRKVAGCWWATRSWADLGRATCSRLALPLRWFPPKLPVSAVSAVLSAMPSAMHGMGLLLIGGGELVLLWTNYGTGTALSVPAQVLTGMIIRENFCAGTHRHSWSAH